jgi:nucleoside-diphosphate-sugar epimerase
MSSQSSKSSNARNLHPTNAKYICACIAVLSVLHVLYNQSMIFSSFWLFIQRSQICILSDIRIGMQAVADEYPNRRIGFVHIDDVVKAHLLAMEEPGAHGRYICSSDVAHFRDIMSMLRTKYPKLQIQASR